MAAYRGSWERPDDGFADAVSATVAKGDAPDFEMPAETAPGPDMDSPRQLASHDAVPPPPVADDYQRARESPLFPVMSTSFDRPPIDRPDGGHLTAAVPGTDGPASRLTAAQPAADGLFAPRSGPLAPAKPE